MNLPRIVPVGNRLLNRRFPTHLRKAERPINTFLRLKKVLVASLGVSEEAITLDITLGDLFHRSERPTPPRICLEIVNDSIVDSLGPNSLDIVELGLWLDDEFGLSISDEDAKSLPPLIFDTEVTVQQMVEFIGNHATR